MRKMFVLLLASVVMVTSCSKDDGPDCSPVNITAPAEEVQALRDYLTTNSITATEDSRGFFYTITAAGSGAKPTVCNAVTVNYSGKLTNGTSFDAASGVSFNLSQLIVGWQEGIPLIAKGGKITLYLPPSLGYGSAAVGSIPANSILIFDIDLVDFF